MVLWVWVEKLSGLLMGVFVVVGKNVKSSLRFDIRAWLTR